MSTPLPLPPENGGGRFPSFDVLRGMDGWDAATQDAIRRRTEGTGVLSFFTPDEEKIARGLLDRLVGQPNDAAVRIDLVGMVDSRLARDETDGWNFDTMPPDPIAWRRSLAGLDDDAQGSWGRSFAACSDTEQEALIEAVRVRPAGDAWHGLSPGALWGLWTRYAATAFYSHPLAWNEIGFSGPAYPRGYKNIGIGRREPFEVADADPRDDPSRRGSAR